MWTGWTWTYLLLTSVVGLVALGFLATCLFGIIKGLLWLFGLSATGLSWLWHRLTGRTPDSHGSSHWAEASEIARKGLFTPGGLTLGTWHDKPLYDNSGGHVAIIAPPRSWKSTSFLAPNMVGYAGSLLVNDPRGELWATCHVDREAMGPTYRFNPTGKASCGLNVVDAVRWHQDEAFGDVQRLAHGLLSPEVGLEWDDFRLQAAALLTPILLHVQGSLPHVRRWLVNPATSMADQSREMLGSPNPQVQEGGRRLRDLLTSERTASIVWGRLVAALEIYSDPIVAANTERSDLNLRDLQHATRPVSIFMTAPFADVARLRPLFGTLTEMLCALFSAQQEPPRQPVALFLDETANLGKLDQLERGQSYLQGCGVQIIQTWQNVLQLRSVYGKDSPILASCTRVYYTPSDQETAEDLSTQLGVTTARLRPQSDTRTFWGMLASTTVGTTEHERRLLTADECRTLEETAAVVIVKGLAPILAQKLGSPARELIDLATPRLRNVAMLAGALLLGGSVIAWAWALMGGGR